MSQPKIVIAPNAFKGTLTAQEAADAIARGIRRAAPDAKIRKVPIADGGDGTLDVLMGSHEGRFAEVTVTGPLGEPVTARYGITTGSRRDAFGSGAFHHPKGILEMAESSGLRLVPAGRRDVLKATTFGLGEVIRAALDEGLQQVVIGLGGSATVDGGAGMAEALGARLLGKDGSPLPPGGGSLADLDRVDLSEMDPRIRKIHFIGLRDVDSPLLGERGAATVYGPQKGASPEDVERLVAGLARLQEVLVEAIPGLDRDRPGDGAAGGLGFGVRAFLGGTLNPGAGYVLFWSGFSEARAGASLVITGEGKVDGQTWQGKAVAEVVSRCGRQVSTGWRRKDGPKAYKEAKERGEKDALLKHVSTKRLSAVPCWVITGQAEGEIPERYRDWTTLRVIPEGSTLEHAIEKWGQVNISSLPISGISR